MKKKVLLTIVGLLCRLHLLKPIQVARIRFYYKFHRWPNFEHPRDLNEKINWLKFYGDTSRWADLSDKFKVREYIKEKGLEDILVKLYGKWDRAEDIDLDTLPNQFVMKANNGCGDVLICQDKSQLNEKTVKAHFKRIISQPYGVLTGEPHYAAITPCIIAEELLDVKSQVFESSSMIDYKIWCINGKPSYISVYYNRTSSHTNYALFDTNWVQHPELTSFSEHYASDNIQIPKPERLNEMLEVASILSKDFPFLRCDLYYTNGRIYFGEMTFTPRGGFLDSYSEEFLNKTGAMLKLSQKI